MFLQGVASWPLYLRCDQCSQPKQFNQITDQDNYDTNINTTRSWTNCNKNVRNTEYGQWDISKGSHLFLTVGMIFRIKLLCVSDDCLCVWWLYTIVNSGFIDLCSLLPSLEGRRSPIIWRNWYRRLSDRLSSCQQMDVCSLEHSAYGGN